MLVVAAVEAELGPLEGVALGIGALRAAAAAARLLAVRRPEAVVLVGSAGAYPGGPAPGGAVASARLGLEGGVADLGRGYDPAPAPVLASDEALAARLGLPRADVLTVHAVTTDPALVAARAGAWGVEHMEAWGVAWAAAEAGVPFVAVLGLANEVGPQAHAQWRVGRAAAERAAQEAVRRLVHGSTG
ncbi:MAG: hypothetical protein H6732_10915 [Alphaproteobacteria bacterium]|nr:hypothetical protein [Alphaproteobacteria bacterium]